MTYSKKDIEDVLLAMRLGYPVLLGVHFGLMLTVTIKDGRCLVEIDEDPAEIMGDAQAAFMRVVVDNWSALLEDYEFTRSEEALRRIGIGT